MTKIKSKKGISLIISITIVFNIIITIFTNGLNVYAQNSTDVSNLYPVDSTYSFIKSLEGCDLKCFWDVAQWTIGWGNKCPYEHTTNGTKVGQRGGHSISQEYADELFIDKLSNYVNILKSNCKGLSMSQNQFDALLSATYNHGNVNSCPLKYYLQGILTETEAREKYYVWCINAGSSTETALRNRRKKEADLFFSNSTSSISAPTYAKLSSDKIKYNLGETINFTFDSDFATNYYFRICDNNGDIFSETFTTNTYSTTLPAGKYSASMSAFNNNGTAHAGWINFEVVDTAPTYAKLSSDKIKYNLGETINFTFDSDFATNYYFRICDNNGDIFSETFTTNTYSTTLPAGKYSASMSAFNNNGTAHAGWINFEVVDTAPTYAKLLSDKTTYNLGETINFTFDSDFATNYYFRICDNNGDIFSETFITNTYSTTLPVGKYSASMSAFNNNGTAHAGWINFEVVDLSSIQDIGTNFCAYIINTEAWKMLTNESNNSVVMHTETDCISPEQVWKFIKKDDGSYKIINCKTRKALDSSDPNENLYTCDNSESICQDWYIYGESGAYYLKSKSSNKVIDIAGGSTNDGTKADIYDWNGTTAQKFQILKLDTWSNLGDLNNDYFITTTDILILKKYILNTEVVIPNPQVADINSDGMVNVIDLILLKHKYINSF